MDELKMINCKLIVIVVNKKINAKIFSGDSLKVRVSGAQSGTILDTGIVEKNSFLLIS